MELVYSRLTALARRQTYILIFTSQDANGPLESAWHKLVADMLKMAETYLTAITTAHRRHYCKCIIELLGVSKRKIDIVKNAKRFVVQLLCLIFIPGNLFKGAVSVSDPVGSLRGFWKRGFSLYLREGKGS